MEHIPLVILKYNYCEQFWLLCSHSFENKHYLKEFFIFIVTNQNYFMLNHIQIHFGQLEIMNPYIMSVMTWSLHNVYPTSEFLLFSVNSLYTKEEEIMYDNVIPYIILNYVIFYLALFLLNWALLVVCYVI